MARRPVRTFVNKWSRKLHRWGAVLTALPVLIVICTGLLLQVKKQFEWIQPATAKGSGGELTSSFDQILEATRTSPWASLALLLRAAAAQLPSFLRTAFSMTMCYAIAA